jgi:hypothetical protein
MNMPRQFQNRSDTLLARNGLQGDVGQRSGHHRGTPPRSRLRDNVTSRSPKTTDAIQCPRSDSFWFARHPEMPGAALTWVTIGIP